VYKNISRLKKIPIVFCNILFTSEMGVTLIYSPLMTFREERVKKFKVVKF